MASQANYTPGFAIEVLKEQYPEDADRILSGYSASRHTTLRVNALKATKEEVASALDGAGISWEPVGWYDDAFVLESSFERRIWDLPVYQNGGVYVQSLSSMLPPLILNAQAGEDVLDMCAAPGGKTCQIASLSKGKAHVAACELNAVRADKLEYNLAKQGATGVNVMRTDARKLDDFFRFDKILLDAPCSGSGTVNAFDPRTEKRLTPQLVEKSCKNQRKLLAKALGLMKPGSVLVYSTCSIFKEENEKAVSECLSRASKRGDYRLEPIALSNEIPTLPSSMDGCVTVCPDEFFEGFFMACIKRYA